MVQARSLRWPLVLLALFSFRLLFGLSSEFYFEDETQIFLIGLRHYTTGQWPFFGPDVVWTKSEIPGALQGLLVGVPLGSRRSPNRRSCCSTCCRSPRWRARVVRVPSIVRAAPRWLIWGWFLTVPWTLQFSDHVNQPVVRAAGGLHLLHRLLRRRCRR